MDTSGNTKMSIEQKAKAYDEALELARKIHSGEGVDAAAGWSTLETIFPQLRDSEDERIRRTLVEYFGPEAQLDFIRGVKIQKIRDWLEKQKDHFRDDTKKVEKQDYSGLNDLERAIHRCFLSAGVENVPVTIIKETANECKRTQTIANENANAEWNEDDESFYDSIMCEVIKEGMHPTPAQANWLKSLPERFNLQPKQEWSEEDKDMLNSCISSIEEAKENRYAYKETDGDTSYDREIAWLKYLRPQPKQEWSEEDELFLGVCKNALSKYERSDKWDANIISKWLETRLKSLRPQPHWKPSEEQMNCLCAAVDRAIRKHNESVGGYKPARVLKSLYEQLQKLGMKEEPEYYQHFDPDC